ncbi:MAG: tetratricopeptide repeat protein [Phycisphaerae bacterium]|nr:tetratricopeptide repeat protein [Phycisphaerae bacterium]
MHHQIRAAAILMTWLVAPGLAIGAAAQTSSATRPATQSARKPAMIAVLTFKNLKADKQTDWVGEGAAETLTTQLTGVPQLIVIERTQVKQVLDEQDFQKTDVANPDSAVEVGKVLGAERIVIGTFASEGGSILFNVRVVDVKTAVVLSAVSLTGRSSQIFETLSKLTDAVIESFDKKVVVVGSKATAVAAPRSERIVLTDAQRTAVRKQGTTNLTAYSAFSKALAAKSPDERIRLYDQAIKADPKYAWAYNNRGNAYLDKGLLDRAVQDYDRAIRLQSDYTLAYRNRGTCYYRKRDYSRALRDAETAIRLDPKYSPAYNDRGVVYFRTGKTDWAIANFSKAIELQANFGLAYRNRGLGYAKKGLFQQAVQDYDTAILLSPREAVTHYHKAVACERLNRRVEAASAYRRYLALERNTKDSKVRKARQQLSILERR